MTDIEDTLKFGTPVPCKECGILLDIDEIRENNGYCDGCYETTENGLIEYD